MAALKTCPECGATLSGDGPGGSCPACLLGLAVDSNANHSEAQPVRVTTRKSQIPNPTVRYFGDYELLGEIARGGMGIVYRARQVSLNRPVALKMIAAGQLATPSAVQRFRTEAEAAARLDHPHIVPICEIGEHEGRHYFSMKLIEGGTLSQERLNTKDQRFKSAEEIARVVATVARAVHYAHQRGILHRDLKPTNILLDEQGEPHVTDFGLAKLLKDDSSLTHSMALLGTPSYMAPEQAAGGAKQLTTAADVYSLGAVLFELLTGQPPFRADTPVETLRQVCEQELTSPHALNPAVNQELETICLKCLGKDPQRRYGSAEMLAQDLDRWRNGEPILARPVGWAEKAWLWCQRRPVIAGLLLALHIVLAAGLAGIVWEWRRAERNADSATDKLRQAYIAQARADRRTDGVGRLYDSLAAVSNAAALKPTPAQREELRNEAIACFTLTDLRMIKQWSVPAADLRGILRSDSRLQLYARRTGRDPITICKTADDSELARLPETGVDEGIDSFSPDGRFLMTRFLMTASLDWTNRLWEIATGRLVLAFPDGGSRAWAFSPDSRLFAVVTGDSLSVYSVNAWAEPRRVPLSGYRSLQFLSDSRRIAGISRLGDRLEIADVRTGTVLETLTTENRLDFSVCSATGDLIAAGSKDGHLHVWNLLTGRYLDITAHQGGVTAVALNGAGTLLASLSSLEEFRLWDPLTGHPILSGLGLGQHIEFAEDDRYLTLGNERNISLFEIVSPPSFRLLAPAVREPSRGTLAFSPDGRLLAATGDNDIRFWDVATAKELGVVPDEAAHVVRFPADGKRLITGDRGLYQWPIERVEGPTNTLRLGPRTPLIPGSGLMSVSLSSNGRFALLTRPPKASAQVFDSENPSSVATLGPNPGIMWGAVSPDGRFVATDTYRGEGAKGVKIWDVAGRQALRDEELRDLPAWSAYMLFSPDGRWLATRGADYRLYEVGSWKLRMKPPVPPDPSPVHVSNFSPDGEIWAIGNPPHNTQLYATTTGQRLAVLEPPQPAMIATMAFSPDGTMLAILQSDRAVQLWDLRGIRGQLGALGLDWKLAAYPAMAANSEMKPIRIELTEYPVSARRRAFLAREIPPRSAEADARLIDLSDFYNAALTESWHDGEGRNDLSDLTPGLRKLAGVMFDVRGLIQVGGASRDGAAYAKAVRGIRVSQACSRLHFLHAAIFANEVGAGVDLGSYRVHYSDGHKVDIPIVLGKDVLDWFSKSGEDLSGVVVAWTGQNEDSRRANQQIRLFKTTWVNPFPLVPISGIDFLCGQWSATPFLVAITAE
jgi:WD40 repeat protein